MGANDEELAITVHTPVWMRSRKCRDMDPGFFFPSGGNGDVQRVRAFCNGGVDGDLPCPVRDECLEHALVHGEKFGVWGGQSERGRRRLTKAWRQEQQARSA